ncbi:MAG: hypothetical protein P0Y65_19360 [Candidatus Devosia phytovorans]|uniref:EF-hand domain-containing protein n=1 Tax=Candidatus Devosia phytovorans TaxID=3121372 RepID=A0AAJ5VVS7_9HYPH|nr:hypothetical protein [Devosia sp.]WEK04309.1 MAG: hypothetical protein P0Y65_19360 [Devosia sp.]
MKKFALGLAIAGLTATAALAQTPMSFGDVDTDGNGELSYAELQAVWPDLGQPEFDAADADASGGLNADELNSLQPAAAPAAPAAPAPAPDASLGVPDAGLGADPMAAPTETPESLVPGTTDQ